MNVRESIERAERLLPGVPAPEGAEDPRWQAIITVSEFIDSDAEEVWSFIRRWGESPDPDLRAAVATCLLEHLLEHHFEQFFPRVEAAARASSTFADTVGLCWKFGQSGEAANAAQFERLLQSVRSSAV